MGDDINKGLWKCQQNTEPIFQGQSTVLTYGGGIDHSCDGGTGATPFHAKHMRWFSAQTSIPEKETYGY